MNSARCLAGVLMLFGWGCKSDPPRAGEDAPAAAPGDELKTGSEGQTASHASTELERPRAIVEAGPDEHGKAHYRVEIPNPRWPAAAGPRVALDEAHDNLAIPENYALFADALRADGFVVEANERSFDAEALAEVDLLVVVNPLHPSNVGNWRLPTPSAFEPEEIDAVDSWVRAGGALWLIADHMPFPGAAAELAARFGFELNNGFAFRQREPGRIEQSMISFRRADGTIVAGHPITDGLMQLQSFTGEAFEAPPEATPLLVMPPDGISLMPEIAWEFDEHTPTQAVGGWPVAAVRELGRGRVAVFGEAAMLSGRYVDNQGTWVPVGMHHPEAHDNLSLVLHTARWLVERTNRAM